MGPYETVIQRCLEKDPARRFQNVAELAAALAPFAGPIGPELATAVARVLRGSQVSMVQPGQTVMATSTPTTLRRASGVMQNRTHASGRSWRLPAVIGAGIAGGVLAVVIATTVTGGGTHTAAPAEPTKPVETAPATTPAAPSATTPTSTAPTTGAAT